MPTFNRILEGGRSISSNADAPRSRRGNTAQVDTYWSGLVGGGTDAIGGIGPSKSTGSGYRYLEFNSTGALTVTGAGSFQFYIFGGGGGGMQANGYNGFAAGGSAGSNTTITKVLGVGTYTVTVGAGGAGSTAYASSAGGDSYFDNDIVNKGAGGAGGGAGGAGLLNINGAAGTDVSTFIGGASLFKGAGGGNPTNGNGGSSIGGNGRTYPTSATSAAANTASGGGGANADGLPNFNILPAGSGGSGIVYVRWRA